MKQLIWYLTLPIMYLYIFFKRLYVRYLVTMTDRIKDFNELLSVNAGGISTTELIDLIYKFCELYSSVIFYPYQELFARRLIRSVLENDGEDITALFSRQSGKSETVATVSGGLMIILPQLALMPMFADDKRLEMFKDGMWIGIFAPSLRQAQITYGRIKKRIQCPTALKVLEDPDFRLQFNTSNGQTVSLTNGSFATSISASEGSNIEGESFKLIILDESQDISNYKIRKSITPMGASYNATIVKIGTSSTFVGDFYDSIQRNKKRYEDGELKYKNHFEFDCDVVSKYNPKYAKFVEKEKMRLGEYSDEYQMSYKLKWIISRGMFVEMKKFEKNNISKLLMRVPNDTVSSHVVGIDVAGKNDSTVVTVVEVDWENPVVQEENTNEEGETVTYTAYNTYVKDWLEINHDDMELQYVEIMDFLSNFCVKKIFIDSTKESSLAHRIRANHKASVTPYVFTTPSKSIMYKALDREIKSGRLKIPGDKDCVQTREYQNFCKQLEDLQKGYSGANMVVSHPDGRGYHDDYPDSLALAILASIEPSEANSIEVIDTKDFIKGTSSFARKNRQTGRRRR